MTEGVAEPAFGRYRLRSDSKSKLCNMYTNTRFNDLLKALPKYSFNKICKEHQSDKFSKGFSTWNHLIAMIYGQIHGCKSLRELETSFNNHSNHHYHLGTKPLKRSTLSDANQKRDSHVFEHICKLLMGNATRHIRKELKEFLYIIDSTPIQLKGPGYDEWGVQNKTYRTQGLKTHVLIEGSQSIPLKVGISAPNVNDIEWGRGLDIEAGATYVFDRGYYDYNWWYRLNIEKAIYVTRFKNNAGVNVLETFHIPENEHDTIIKDEKVVFKNRRPGGNRINFYHGTELRRIHVDMPTRNDPLIIATNDFERSAKEIADLYKKRWGIELFFKWLKQNLKIKSFLGRSKNAVKIQIYTALIAYLLIYQYRTMHGSKFSIREALIILRTGLFQRPELEKRRQRISERLQEHPFNQGVLQI